MGKLDIAVRLAAIISITTGTTGVVIQVRTTGLDVDSVIAGAFIGVVLTGAVVVAATELIRRRTRAWMAEQDAKIRTIAEHASRWVPPTESNQR